MKKRFLLVVVTLVVSACLIACDDQNAAEIINVEIETETVVETESEVEPEVESEATVNESEEAVELEDVSASEEEKKFVPPFTIDRTYYEAEQLINITPLKITNDPGNIVWTSEDPNIAQVVNGRLLYLTEGETVISADTEDQHKEINVSVSGSISFATPLESVTVKEHENYVVIIDNDVTLPEGFEEKLDELITLAENRTGLSYVRTDKEEDFYLADSEMISVVISDKISTSFASSGEVFLKAEHLIVDEANGVTEEKVYAVVLEELLHCVQLRNSVSLGKALTEGYAIVNAYKIVEEDLGYIGATERYVAEQIEYMAWFDRLSSENVYKMLIAEPIDVHPYSFFFVKYLYETYGDTILDELIQETNKTFYEKSPEHYGGGSVSDVLTSEDFKNIIISHTSETVLSDYVSWMRANGYN